MYLFLPQSKCDIFSCIYNNCQDRLVESLVLFWDIPSGKCPVISTSLMYIYIYICVCDKCIMAFLELTTRTQTNWYCHQLFFSCGEGNSCVHNLICVLTSLPVHSKAIAISFAIGQHTVLPTTHLPPFSLSRNKVCIWCIDALIHRWFLIHLSAIYPHATCNDVGVPPSSVSALITV